MRKENNLGRLLALLLLTCVICFALYGLPDEVFGHTLKKVDLLADIRIKPETTKTDLEAVKQMIEQEEKEEIEKIESIATNEVAITENIAIEEEKEIVKTDTVATTYIMPEADAAGLRIEDYSTNHSGLKRFFSALKNRNQLDRPVRIAFMGDSFIEGDIMVADFRSALQKEFGGRGVGFIPMTSVTAQFRPTIDHKAEGWKSWSMLHDQSHQYVLPGTLFEVENESASITLKNTTRYPELQEAGTVQLIYEQNKNTFMQLAINGEEQIFERKLPPTQKITKNTSEGNIKEVSYRFTDTEGFRALGIALEDLSGVIVDNFSLRGNSGMILDRLDKERCHEFAEVRPYDLIILQYGLNVISEEMLEYGWYRQRMIAVVQHLQECFPNSDIMLLSVTDRSHQIEGQFETMPAVLAMVHAQRQIARRAAIPFWNMFGAMGGENSMVRYVENNWASKDYTHFSFRGGRELANALMKALLLEKDFYDEAEKGLN